MLKVWGLERLHKLFTSSKVIVDLQQTTANLMGQGKRAVMLTGEVAWAKDFEYSNSTQHIQISHYSSQGLSPSK